MDAESCSIALRKSPRSACRGVRTVVQALYWKDYAEFEVGHGGDNAAKALLSRCLLQCPNVELWRAYLQLVRRVGG